MGACLNSKQGVITPVQNNGMKRKSWVTHNSGVKFAWESSNGMIRMINCDTTNALQSVLQVLIRIRPLMNFFMCEQMPGNYGKLMNNLFDNAYKPRSQKGLSRLGNSTVSGFDKKSVEEQNKLIQAELEADF